MMVGSWFEHKDVVMSHTQLSYHTLPIPPAIADSMPLHDALRTRLSWLSLCCWLKWLELLLFWIWDWKLSPFFPIRGHPPNQAIVDNFSELETQSLIVRCLDPWPHGFESQEEVGDFVFGICCCLSWNSLFEAQLEPLPMETFPVDDSKDLLSLSDSFLLASRRAAATSMLPVLDRNCREQESLLSQSQYQTACFLDKSDDEWVYHLSLCQGLPPRC